MSKVYLIFLFCVTASCLNAQVINLRQIGHPISTELPKKTINEIESTLNADEFRLSLVAINPTCISTDCFQLSLIQDEMDLSLTPKDSLFGVNQFIGIDVTKIESSVSIKEKDVERVLGMIFHGKELEYSNMCYEPRHAILIQDSAGKVVAVFEICFECSKCILAVQTSNYLNMDLNELKALFTEYGFVIAEDER